MLWRISFSVQTIKQQKVTQSHRQSEVLTWFACSSDGIVNCSSRRIVIVMMAPKSKSKAEGRQVQDKESCSKHKQVIRRFEEGVFENIDLGKAEKLVGLCEKKTCNVKCLQLHVNKKGNKKGLRPTVGLQMAWDLLQNPVSHLSDRAVRLLPQSTLQAYLRANGIGLIIEGVDECEDAYVFKFVDQNIGSHILQFAKQRTVYVQVDGQVKKLDASKNISSVPKLCIHGVKEDDSYMENDGRFSLEYGFLICLDHAQDMVIIGYGDSPTNKTTTVNDSFEAIQISTPSTA